jgi:hypothetical protein
MSEPNLEGEKTWQVVREKILHNAGSLSSHCHFGLDIDADPSLLNIDNLEHQ